MNCDGAVQPENVYLHAEYAPCSERDTSGCPTVSRYLEDYFGYRFDFRWWCVLILLAFIAVFRVAAMIALKFVSHEHR